MEISGHRTRSVFDRYDIVDEIDMVNAVAVLRRLNSQFRHVAPRPK